MKVQCFGHGPKWLNHDPEKSQVHELSEADAVWFISTVTQGGYGDESWCVLRQLPGNRAGARR
jgi:hypothetical protein